MIVWGTGGDVVQLGAAGQGECQSCERERNFRNVLAYRYAHIWYLFSWVTQKQYMTVCEACNRGFQHDSKSFEAKLGKSPIPFYRRFGGLVLLGLIGVFVLVGILASQNAARHDVALLAGPQVGDRYSVDLGEVVPGGFEGKAYGVVRVSGVEGGQVTLEVPQTGYDQWRGADTDLDLPKSQASSYYVAGVSRTVSLEDLRHWHPRVLHHAQR
jgi:hypothetical protein